MVELVKHYDTLAVVMASETFVPGGTAQCLNPQDSYRAAKHFVELLVTKAGRRNDQIIIDPGLAPVGADTYGLVNIGLDAMRLISADPDLKGVHMIVGLSNFAWGTPKEVREDLEKAYLTLGMEAGLDFALANPEKTPAPLAARSSDGGQASRGAGSRAAAAKARPLRLRGFRQAEAIMAIAERCEALSTSETATARHALDIDLHSPAPMTAACGCALERCWTA